MAPSEPSDDQALHFLATQGWLPLILGDQPGFVEAYQALQSTVTRFFDLPEDSVLKTSHQAVSGAQASEEGYFQIPGEKSILTIKSSGHCPEFLIEDAKLAWDLSGNFMAKIMKAIALSLDLAPNVFAPFVSPCKSFPSTERTPTLLRMFRYERPLCSDPKISAEAHKDLGLLSLVVGHSPGLHVRNTATGLWVPVEEDAVVPPGTKSRSGGLTATLLGGETLAFLTRGHYKAGVHSVVCDLPSSNLNYDLYRYSIVFTLRAADAPIYTRDFESEIVGYFGKDEMLEGKNSKDVFVEIMKAHYNVNATPAIREEQKNNQKERARQMHGQG